MAFLANTAPFKALNFIPGILLVELKRYMDAVRFGKLGTDFGDTKTRLS